MPFRSRSQMRKIAELESAGKLPKGTFRAWMRETPSVKGLPERKVAAK